MSPASKSKPKDKRAGKESLKASSKPSGTVNAGSGVPASGYNPLWGTCHTLEILSSTSALSFHTNGRFRNIDETDDNLGSSLGAGVEYDTISNNGSWSGESEDHKDKSSTHTARQEIIPGADNDKREKIRQKNERKHQRQKERRAQELHERCSGYLMSRKLEVLAHQLVAMGFSSERATMALISNEGKVEESVAWLFEGEEEADAADKQRNQNFDASGNLKIDISKELSRIAEMGVRFRCTKQEVERAVVNCEGDLDKAAETLKAFKHEPPAAAPKPEQNGDPPVISNSKITGTTLQNLPKAQLKPNPSTPVASRKDEKYFNYTKAAGPVGVSAESALKSVQTLRRAPSKVEWIKPQQINTPSEKKWLGDRTNPLASYSVASPLQTSSPPTKIEARYMTTGGDLKNLQLSASSRDQVISAQVHQTLNAKQNQFLSVATSSSTTPGWYPNTSVETLNRMPLGPNSRSVSPDIVNSNQIYQHQPFYQPLHQSSPVSSHLDSSRSSRVNVPLSKTSSPTIAAASSLGLYTGLGASNGSSGSSSLLDWSSAGSMLQLDYSNIDWSLDRGMTSLKSDGMLWAGYSPFVKSNSSIYDSNGSGIGTQPALRAASSVGGGAPFSGLKNGGIARETPKAASREWTSPFEAKDLFSLPRKFVSPSSL